MRISLVIVFALIVSCWTANELAGQNALQNEQNFSSDSIVASATEEWARLKNVYANGIETELECTFNGNAPSKMHLCVWNMFELNHIQNNEGETIEIVNDKYAFSLARESPSAAWILDNIHDSPIKMKENRQFTHGLLESSVYAFGFLFFENGWIVDMMNAPSFEIESIESQKTDTDEELVKIHFRCDHNLDNNNRVRRGEIVLDPANSWAPIECDLTIDFFTENVERSYRLNNHYVYHKMENDFAFPSMIETTYYNDGVPPIQNKIVYTSVKKSDLDKSVFYLSHYGFSEPGEPGRRIGIVNIVLMIASIVLIILGLYWRWFAMKKS